MILDKNSAKIKMDEQLRLESVIQEMLNSKQRYLEKKRKEEKRFIEKRKKDQQKHLDNYIYGRNVSDDEKETFLFLLYTRDFEKPVDYLLKNLDENIRSKKPRVIKRSKEFFDVIVKCTKSSK